MSHKWVDVTDLYEEHSAELCKFCGMLKFKKTDQGDAKYVHKNDDGIWKTWDYDNPRKIVPFCIRNWCKGYWPKGWERAIK